MAHPAFKTLDVDEAKELYSRRTMRYGPARSQDLGKDLRASGSCVVARGLSPEKTGPVRMSKAIETRQSLKSQDAWVRTHSLLANPSYGSDNWDMPSLFLAPLPKVDERACYCS